MADQETRTARRPIGGPRTFDGAGLRWSAFPTAREGSAVRHVLPTNEAITFVESLPSGPGKRALRRTVQAILAARSEQRQVILAADVGLFRAGMAPVVLDLIERGAVSAVCLEGDAARFDVEIALFGKSLPSWQQNGPEAGLWEETGAVWTEAVRRARARRLGLGRALGYTLEQRQCRFLGESVLAACAKADIQTTVHLTAGSLGFELHADFMGADFGEAIMIDFRALMQAALGLAGGVWLHAAGFMPLGRLFCRALALMANLEMPPDTLTCALMGTDPYVVANEEFRHACVTDRHPGRRVLFLPGAPEFVLPLLRGMILRESGLADIYRDL